jgi:hypothetical protein
VPGSRLRAFRELRQLAYPGEATYPGESLFPNQRTKGFGEAWDAVVDAWPPNQKGPPGDKDRVHVETHLFEKRDLFITDDGPLLAMCERLSDHGFPVVAMRLTDYLDSRAR